MPYHDDDYRNELADALFNMHDYPEYAHLEMRHLRQIPTDELRRMVAREPLSPDTLRIVNPGFKHSPVEQPAPATQQATLRPLAPALAWNPNEPALRPVQKRNRAPRLWRAQLWHVGRNVYLGRFYTDVEALKAIEHAKFRRSLGLPIK